MSGGNESRWSLRRVKKRFFSESFLIWQNDKQKWILEVQKNAENFYLNFIEKEHSINERVFEVWTFRSTLLDHITGRQTWFWIWMQQFFVGWDQSWWNLLRNKSVGTLSLYDELTLEIDLRLIGPVNWELKTSQIRQPKAQLSVDLKQNINSNQPLIVGQYIPFLGSSLSRLVWKFWWIILVQRLWVFADFSYWIIAGVCYHILEATNFPNTTRID